MRRQRYITVDGFSPQARKLRAHFEERFADPRQAGADRFIWDYWHVPGQYTHLRTPAYHFFPKKLYEEFHRQLAWWGRRNLGCHDISPPWLSCYVDGCGQSFHGDLPHGPWAFVFSLSPKLLRYTGGETLLIREEILSYWQGFAASGGLEKGLEETEVIERIASPFNRLTVFDPRIPHGVSTVRGVQDPREGRLVIHGWFVQPRPFLEGPLSTGELQERIEDLTRRLEKLFSEGEPVQGVLSVSFQVSAAGRTSRFKVLSNALRAVSGLSGESEQRVVHLVRAFVDKTTFSRKKASSTVTLPLIFSTG